MNLAELVQQVLPIAKDAGKVILDIYDKGEDIQVELKSDESPLTIADKAANDLICERLKQLDPQLPIISEENKAIPYSERSGFEYTWMVDPLDGTKEFIKRNGEFTVNIALIHNQEVVLGVVYAPVLDQMFYAARGEGAFQMVGDKPHKLEAPTFTMSDSNLKVVCSRSHLNDATQAFVDDLESPELTPQGSSLKFTIIAKGDAHVYPRLAPTMEWDTAAAQIVLEEAGGTVLDAKSKMPLQYNKEDLLNPHFIAYGTVK